MAKYYGVVGFSTTVETSPGIWTEQIIRKPYKGDVLRIARRYQPGDKINDDMSVGNEISIIADSYAYVNFPKICYVEWMGIKWKVSNIVVDDKPRIKMTLGEVYNE